MLLYHGSDHVIEKLQFGAGKKHNDYRRGELYISRIIDEEIKKDDLRI